MLTYDLEQFNKITENTKLIHGTPEHKRILLTENGRIIKLFHSKRRYLHAKRFCRNASRYLRRGFIVAKPGQIYCCPEASCVFVLYQQIVGRTLLDCMHDGDQAAFYKMPAFLLALHKAGIYFRDSHPGNFLCQDNDGFAILDFQDSHFFFKALGMRRRAKNIVTFLYRHNNEMPLEEKMIQTFVNNYLDLANLNALHRWQFHYFYNVYRNKEVSTHKE